MSEIVRFSVSLESELLEQFDAYCRRQQFATRSEAVRQVIRRTLTAQAWQSQSGEVAGTLTLVYDHHRPQLRDRLMELQHEHTRLIVSTMHAHLTHDLCLEVIMLRGPAPEIQQLAARLQGMKGIHRGEFVVAAVAEEHHHEG